MISGPNQVLGTLARAVETSAADEIEHARFAARM